MRFLRTVVRGSALLALSGAFVACGDGQSSTAPAVTATSLGTPTMANVTYGMAKGLIVNRTLAIETDVSETRRISPRGGYIYLKRAGIYVWFPAGAVAADLDVTVIAHAGSKVIYTFEPHGTTFLQPVLVLQELRYTELNTPRSEKNRPAVWAGYLQRGLSDVGSDGTGTFSEVFTGAYHGKGNDALAYFWTTHFSGYAMASGRRESAGQ